MNGVCDNPKTWLELAPTTILASDLNRGYNSPYDFIATFLDKFGRPLKYTQVSFKANNNNYNVITDPNGVAKLVLKLDVGTYSITAVNIDGTEVIKTVNILKRITGNSNLNKDYLGGTYKVSIVGDDGNYVKSGQIVTFKIGKKVYNVKTDANGYASLAIKQTPGKYQITATYNGNTVKNTIKVKRILKASNISKKKAKKIKYTATLKTSAGKAIKNKKITFKIKGKTYRAKTNKKGKATITLKKLKVGKYKITIKYVNDSIKRAIKIKK